MYVTKRTFQYSMKADVKIVFLHLYVLRLVYDLLGRIESSLKLID